MKNINTAPIAGLAKVAVQLSATIPKNFEMSEIAKFARFETLINFI